MAHIRKHPTTGKPQVRYIDPWRKERSRTFDMMRDARAFMAEVEVAVSRGEYLDPRKGSITLSDWSERWLESRRGVRPSTKSRDRSYVRNHIVPDLGSLRLSEIAFDHVQEWVGRLESKELAPATVRKAYQILAQILELAVKARRIGWNPARGVELPSLEEPDPRFITSEEIDRLADIIERRFRALVLLGGYCGTRWGEAAGLAVSRVDLLHRRITIDQALTEVDGVLSLSPPKTKSSVRRIALPQFMIEEIEEHLATFAPGPNGVLVTTNDGFLLRRSNFRRRIWLPAVAAADLSPLPFHALRHSHAALLIAQGEHPKVIADRLGHASPNVTNAIYSHLFDGLDDLAAERLDQARNESHTDFSRTRDAQG